MAILLPALARAREQGKRIVCMSNLKQLTLAWITYTEANNDKIVNGAPQGQYGIQCPDCPTGTAYHTMAAAPPSSLGPGNSDYQNHGNEIPWIGPAESAPDDCAKKCAITTGALWRYVKNDKNYRCPTGMKGELITYTALDAVNGLPRTGTKAAGVWLKNRNQIKRTATQLVYIDEGRVTPDSYAVNFDNGESHSMFWYDPPMVRHGDGTTISFSDGHAECWKWKSKKTVDFGKSCEKTAQYNVFPGNVPGHPEWTQDNDDMQDLYLMQIRCWSRLGYTPPVAYPPQVD
jgi:prepilin-type processing-associated H-X9-DG protein